MIQSQNQKLLKRLKKPERKNKMTKYPSIENIKLSGSIYAFDKLDGSNIRAEWSKKKGFYKFGSKNVLIDEQTKFLGHSVPLIMEKYNEELSKRFVDDKIDRAVIFCEFFGENSFAGIHEESGDFYDVVLFDISIYKKGIMLPKDFLKFTNGLEITKLLYQGKCDDDFVKSVQTGTLQGMTFEGVVCKQNEYHRFGIPKMCKIKSEEWKQKVQSIYNDFDRQKMGIDL